MTLFLRNFISSVFPSVLCLLMSCASGKMNLAHSSELNGSWTPVRQTLGNREVPATVFRTQRLIIHDSLYTFQAESVDKGIVRYAQGRMDIYGVEGVNKDKHFPAIYKIEDGLLTICYNLKGEGYPESFESSAGPDLFVSVFRRER